MSNSNPAMVSAPWDDHWAAAFQQGDDAANVTAFEAMINRMKVDFIGPTSQSGARVIEIGCGSAALLTAVGVREPQAELWALDESPAALEFAASRSGRPIHVVRGDARATQLKSNSFDLVLSGGLLEHFVDPIPVLAEMIRILKPGGVLYADVVPRKLSIYRLREYPRMRRSPELLEGVIETSLDRRWYDGAIAGLGCSDVVSKSCGVYPSRCTRPVARLTSKVDGRKMADWLGWYFMIRATKPFSS